MQIKNHKYVNKIIFLFLFTLNLKAQDPIFSQFIANPLYLNPAYAGIGEGMTINGHYRNQWSNINNGFKTYSVSWCSREPKLGGGIGLTLLKDISPNGIIVSNQINFLYTYNIVDPNERFSIHTGLKTGYNNKLLNWDGLIFSDQLDPILGLQFQTAATKPIFDQVSYWNFATGIIGRFGIPYKGDIADNEIGISINNLNKPIESLQSIGSRLPIRWTIHYLTTFPIVQFGSLKKYYIYLTPLFKYENQKNIMVTTFGLYAATSNITFGMMYQNKLFPFIKQHTNAWILNAGFKWNEDNPFQLGLSYDINTSGINTLSGGIFEISLNFTMSKARIWGESKHNNPLKCYRFLNKSYFL